ncbi:MAG: phytanoyl-CoA dioxygenase family protein [Planctomycetes bacterium]|nr:phytanoyl-CoA dioxygenase family protein [Planctomycetota bacterium]
MIAGMAVSLEECRQKLEVQGFLVLPGVFDAAEADGIRTGLQTAFAAQPQATAIRAQGGSLYAARNVLSLWPETATVWRRAPLLEFVRAILGEQAGLVRGLYFDKPPERTWALPWHKDLTIAVKDNRLAGRSFNKPTTKAGVPHVEAPLEVLQNMLTARIHLDDVTEENGPLRVIPGSHRFGKVMPPGDVSPVSILVSTGDVLVMQPLLAHASNHSQPGTVRHRRILHLEFAGAPLPDGYEWHDFHAVAPTSDVLE